VTAKEDNYEKLLDIKKHLNFPEHLLSSISIKQYTTDYQAAVEIKNS